MTHTREEKYFLCVRYCLRAESDPRDIFFHLIYLSYITKNFLRSAWSYTQKGKAVRFSKFGTHLPNDPA